ncbi:MAG: 2-hydroxyacyl-CoA dehydratase family protein [Clostridiales Family XIII bacterium]|jgi:benzoyl-CoA reductase/2-hydroxyglutaryl-CoA dehydratase subunit BcrC/BadD/HgdB|nr:2-hydroxyacyl-CoA dehydratase family protein [Clostridiales Family XIII bacterium]
MTSKEMLNSLLAAHYENAEKAHEEGKLVAWCTSISPQELLETMGIYAVYPENHAAAIGARKQAPDFINYSESNGYSVDLCSYARVNLAYMDILQSEAGNIPKPDLIWCCSNICNTVLKWYEDIAKELDIPMIVFDTPFNHSYEVTDQNVQYIKGQLLEAIDKLEEITGKKFDYDKFHEIMDISRETSIWWKKASLTARAKPSPLDGFELFNYMATIVCMRGTKEGRDLYKLWYEELTEKAEKGLGPWKANKETGIIPEEKYRVMWDGIACWPYLGVTYKTLKKYGINMVTSTYPDSWYIVYETGDLDGMAKCYSSNYVNRSLDFGINNVVNIVNDFSLDGIVFHSNRSCKLMDFRQFEVQRQVEARTGVPSIIFDGDQTDPRAFNEAQFETRVQALVEMMEARKGK